MCDAAPDIPSIVAAVSGNHTVHLPQIACRCASSTATSWRVFSHSKVSVQTGRLKSEGNVNPDRRNPAAIWAHQAARYSRFQESVETWVKWEEDSRRVPEGCLEWPGMFRMAFLVFLLGSECWHHRQRPALA